LVPAKDANRKFTWDPKGMVTNSKRRNTVIGGWAVNCASGDTLGDPEVSQVHKSQTHEPRSDGMQTGSWRAPLLPR
jgi:hypothetical protein